MNEVRFYFVSIVVLIMLWVGAAVACTLAGLPSGTMAVILVLIGGFASQVIVRYGTVATEAHEREVVARKAEEDRLALARKLEEDRQALLRRSEQMSAELKEVSLALEIADKRRELVDRKRAIESARRDVESAENGKIIRTIHTLVNSNTGAQLKVNMIALKRLAAITKDPDDIAAAEEAEALYHQHQAQQKLVDEKAQSSADESLPAPDPGPS